MLCTPTLISKGFMKPDDLCVVDMEGKQTGGHRQMTSEIKLHLAIMKERPEIKSVVHCHPPHATAFGIAREPVPMCVLPEVEIFLGDVPIAKYDTPGSQEFCRHHPAVRTQVASHHPGQSRHGELRRNGREGLLVRRKSSTPTAAC